MHKLIRNLFLNLLFILFTSQIGVAQMDSTETKSGNDLAWLVGHWEGEACGGICEEDWQPMTAGSMCGTFKLIVDGKVVFYELMIIDKAENGYNLNLKHFNADMTGWEEKDKVVNFPFKSVKENFLKFSGLTYERVGDNKLQITVFVEHSDDDYEIVVIDCVKK